ncbi:MAG: LPS assembly lipoprotein LptE, partial [Acidobacteria bacterium]|nr:LPS assembly lipoprotein LptE [Acidobacteriota bacterium]
RFARAGVLLLLLGVGGCGYHLKGHTTALPPSIKKIGIPIFINKTERPDLEQRLTARIISEFVTRSRYQITSSEEGVDAVVKGEVLVYLLTPVTLNPQGRASRYEILINARVSLVQTSDDQVLWQDDHFVFRRQYDISAVSIGVVSQEQAALDLVADDFAQAVVASILEGF